MDIEELREKVKKLEAKLEKQKKLTRLAQTLNDEIIKEALIEFEKDYIPKQKIKEIVDECVPKKENIITHEIQYTPNTNANSYLVQQILELLQESEESNEKI